MCNVSYVQEVSIGLHSSFQCMFSATFSEILDIINTGIVIKHSYRVPHKHHLHDIYFTKPPLMTSGPFTYI